MDPSSMRALMETLLPAGWRGRVSTEKSSASVLLVRAHDDSGRLHVLEVRPRAPTSQGLVHGDALSYGYRVEDPALAAAVPVEFYREVLGALRTAEHEIVAQWEQEPLSAPSADRPRDDQSFYVTETSLTTLALRTLGSRTRLRSAIQELLERELPDAAHSQLMLYLDNPCAQACEFCELPRRRNRPLPRIADAAYRALQSTRRDFVSSGVFDLVLESLGARRSVPTLMLTGNDWARHPRLDDILTRLEREQRVPVSFCGPSTRLSDLTLAARVAALPTLTSLTLTLESADPAVHDAVTGAPGSGHDVHQAIENLRTLGLSPVVNVVLTARAAQGLSGLLAWLASRQLRTWLLAFLPDETPGGFPATAFAPLDLIREQLETACETAHETLNGIVGLPVCTVPPPLRDRLRPPARGRSRQPAVFAAVCAQCSLRPRCPGIPQSYAAHFGGRGLKAE